MIGRTDRGNPSGEGFVGPVCSRSQGGVHRGDDTRPIVSNPLIVYVTNVFDIFDFGLDQLGSSRPRMYGVTVRYDF